MPRDLVYLGIYKIHNGGLQRLKPYMLLSKEELFKQARPGSIILGDAVGVYREAMRVNIKGANILDKDNWYPKARNLILLAIESAKNHKTLDAFSIKPLYLYPKECQVKGSYKL